MTSRIETQNSAMAYSITKRATVLSVRKCKFCGNPADSREHVIADWILQKINIQDEIRRVVGKSAPVWFRNVQNLRVKSVCTTCNNGWMSALESDSKPTIERLLTGSGIFRLHPAQQAIVARWAVKTAMVFETTAPPPPKSKGHFYPQDECEQLRLNSAIPPRTIVWLGQFSGVGLWESGTHIWHNGEIGECATHGQVVTIVLDHLAIQVFTVHVLTKNSSVTPNIPQREAPCDWSQLTVPIWPVAGSISWPPFRSFSADGPLSIGLLVTRFKTGREVSNDS